MLPPGIFLWKSGEGDDAPPCDLSAVAGAHPGWRAAMDHYGPWNGVVEEAGSTFLSGSGFDGPATILTRRCATTMASARSLAASGVLGPWGSLVAVEQGSGRGQLRRPWVSTPGNLHVSMVMPEAPADGPWRDVLADLRPLVGGWIFGEALRELGADVEIKWPNDLLQAGRKVGGILIEEAQGVVVLGMGLNLVASPPDDRMREDRSVSAGTLQIPGRRPSAATLWQTLVTRGKSVYEFSIDDWTPQQFLAQVEHRLAWVGRPVLVREGDEDAYVAVVKGLSSKGGLVLSRGERDAVLYSGSIFPLQVPYA